MRKRKVRKVSIVYKMLIIAMIITFIFSGAVGFLSNVRAKERILELVGNECSVVGELTSTLIDYSELSNVRPGNNNQEYVDYVKTELNKIANISDIKYIYTLYKDGNSVYYGIDADTENPCDIGEEFPESLEYLDIAFNGDIFVDSNFTEEDGMYLLTTYIPIIYEGEVVGVLDIDSPLFERFDEADQEGLLKIIHVLEGFIS